MHHPVAVVVLVACMVPAGAFIGYHFAAMRFHRFMASGWHALSRIAMNRPVTTDDVVRVFGSGSDDPFAIRTRPKR